MYRLFLTLGFLGFINAAATSCRFADVEKDKGCTGMLINGKSRVTASNRQKVELKCGTGNNKYSCTPGVLKANSPSQDRCGMCTHSSLKKSGNFQHAEATTTPFSRPKPKLPLPIVPRPRSKDEVEHQVKAKASCTGEAPEDAQEFECADGKWTPDPVRCL